MRQTRPAGSGSWAPFAHRAFLWLWLGVVISNVGSWAQTVGAQWLFVDDPNAATIVTLVQTASTLPMMLLALPAGVLADAFDRRWLMFGVQTYFIVVAVLLAALTAAGMMPPALLLAFTFAIGAGQAMLSPTWQAMITELVPRNELAAATRLDMVSVNVARAAGPALAGVVIARWGVPPVFAMTAVPAASWPWCCSLGAARGVSSRRAGALHAGPGGRGTLSSATSRWYGGSCCASPPSSHLRAPSGRCCR